MKNGQLSNEQVPHVLLVFEGALGFLDKDDIVPFRRAIYKERYTDAAYLWKFSPLMCRKIWDVTHRQNVLLEVVTFVSEQEEYVAALEWRVQSEEELPVRKVWATTPEKLGRRLSYMVEVSTVYTPSEKHASLIGPKAKLLTSVSDLGR